MVTGELWLVAGDETGDDSPLTAEPVMCVCVLGGWGIDSMRGRYKFSYETAHEVTNISAI